MNLVLLLKSQLVQMLMAEYDLLPEYIRLNINYVTIFDFYKCKC